MKENSLPVSTRKLIQSILSYLIHHPEAKDTIDGISQWWVSKQEGRHWRKELEKALHWLVAKSWVKERPPGESLYSLNKERLTEIQRFLNQCTNVKDKHS